MPAFITIIMAILSAVVSDMPAIESFLAGVGTFIATEAAKFWPGGTAAGEVSSLVQMGIGIAQDIETAAVDAEAEFKTLIPDLKALLNLFPWMPQFVIAHTLNAKNAPAGASATFVIGVQQEAYAHMQIAKPAVQAQIKAAMAAQGGAASAKP